MSVPRCARLRLEPDHFRWLKKHVRDSISNIGDVELRWAAIGSTAGFAPFWVGEARGVHAVSAVTTAALDDLPAESNACA